MFTLTAFIYLVSVLQFLSFIFCFVPCKFLVQFIWWTNNIMSYITLASYYNLLSWYFYLLISSLFNVWKVNTHFLCSHFFFVNIFGKCLVLLSFQWYKYSIGVLDLVLTPSWGLVFCSFLRIKLFTSAPYGLFTNSLCYQMLFMLQYIICSVSIWILEPTFFFFYF